MNWINQIFKSKESGSAILPVILALGVFGIITAVITQQNTNLMRLNKSRSTINDFKDIKNNFDHIIDCNTLLESLDIDVCQAPDFQGTFIPLVDYKGIKIVKVPDFSGYQVFADQYLIAAKCQGNGYVLIEAAKILKSENASAVVYTSETHHNSLNWYNLFIGRENICGELPYYNVKLDKF